MLERVHVKASIARNAETIRKLHAQIHSTFERRSDGPEALAAWKQACTTFHASYDALAFPGGLSAAFERLADGDMATAEAAIAYLEIHPYFFRSQYNATRFMRALKKFQLRSDLQRRFDVIREAAQQRKRVRTHASNQAMQRTAR